MHDHGNILPQMIGSKMPDKKIAGSLHFTQTPVSDLSYRESLHIGDSDDVGQNSEMSIPIPFWKRCVDIGIILLLLPALALVFLLCSVYIKLVSRGPVFFTQDRIGYRGKLFRIFKFRTMHVHTTEETHRDHLVNLINSNKPMTKLDSVGDKRLIMFAGILRASGLDELPQLINVLRGEMSIIGPRPCTPYEYQMYQPRHKRRLLALPGLTGLWQVSGKNSTTFEEMVALDIKYANSRSFWMDMKILFKTVPVLLSQVKKQANLRLRKRLGGKFAVESKANVLN